MFDEFLHVDAVENVREYLQPLACFVVEDGNCVVTGTYLWPPMFYALASLPSLFLGSVWGSAFVNLFLSALSSVLAFKIGRLLIKDESLALILPAVLVFNPVLVQFAHSAVIDIAFMFFMLLSIYYVVAIKFGESADFIGLVASVVALSLTKIEAPIVAAIFLLYSFYVLKPDGKRKVLFFLGALALIGPMVHTWEIRDAVDGGMMYSPIKLMNNLWFFVDPAYQNPIVIMFCLLGAVEAIKRRDGRFFAFLAIFILVFDICFAEYSYMAPGFSRFFLRVLPAMMVLLAYGVRKLGKSWPVLLLLPFTLPLAQNMIYDELIGAYPVVKANQDTLRELSQGSFLVYKETAVIRRVLDDASICHTNFIEYCRDKPMTVLGDKFTLFILDEFDDCVKEKIGELDYKNTHKIDVIRVICPS